MNGAILIEHIRDGESRLDQTDLREMIRLEKSGEKASGKKTWHIGSEQEHHREIEYPCQKRKEKYNENIREESDKIIVEQSRAISVVHNDVERGEYPTGEGRQKTVAKYMERWEII